MADKESTRAQVQALFDQGKEAKEIAEALGKTPATVYVHIRNIKAERGEKPSGKRGRPPKVRTEGEAPKAEATKTRPRPPAATKSTSDKASTNGHSEAQFPAIRAAIETELAGARSRVKTLERMLETIA